MIETMLDRINRQIPATVEPCVMVIFGASGDLTKRKLIPALYNLAHAGLLPANFAIVGCGVQSNDGFSDQLTEHMHANTSSPFDSDIWNGILKRIHYVQLDVKDTAGFQRLAAKLTEVEREYQTVGNRLFYLAIAPHAANAIKLAG